MIRLGLDLEGTGLDTYHGAMGFLVTFCDEEGENTFWEWDVDPFTRTPIIPPEDVAEIQALIDSADLLYLQNSKYDQQLLKKIGIKNWNWSRVRDTLYGGHLLASNQPHDLTSMALIYLGVNIKPFEDAVIEACKSARMMAGRKDFIERHGQWLLAAEGVEGMPSAGEKNHKYDMWLPRAIALAEGYDDDHPWWNVTNQYANPDSSVVLPLGIEIERRIEQLGLWPIYEERLKLLPVVSSVESNGVTLNGQRLSEQRTDYQAESDRYARICVNIAEEYGHQLELPKGSSVNNSMRKFCFETLQLPVNKLTKKAKQPSLDKDVLAEWAATLPGGTKPFTFVNSVVEMRGLNNAISYMNSYESYWIPLGIRNPRGEMLWYRLHPGMNATGTDTLRWSSENPNAQNISKKEKYNVRYSFGPAPGREWWSCDAQNIELRIPAFEANEAEMVHLFNNPNEPPYFGSYHMLVFDTLHPEKFAKHGMKSKEVYESTWYQWTKNGNFAVQYGAQEYSGTADRAYHVPGAQARIMERFTNIKMLSDQYIKMAEACGYVETMPDKSVCPDRGYPLLCTRTKWGKIKPTVPLSYHVQGTAMWWMQKAMVRCHEFLEQLSGERFKNYFITLQVHDELVFDFPKGKTPTENLPIVKECMRLMAMGGDDLGLPTPVSCKYHPVSWSDGKKVAI